MKSKLIVPAFAAMFFAVTAFAHDGVKHSGSPVEGKVTSLSDKKMEVATDKGSMTVTFEPNTTFEMGMDGEKGKKADLKEGDFVMVEGTKLSQKEVSASEVMIHKADGDSHKEHAK